MTHGHFESTFSKYAFGRGGEGVTKKSTLCTLVKMMTIMDDPLYDNSGLPGSWRFVGRIVILVQQVTLRCHSRVRPFHGAYPHTTYSRLRSDTYVSVAFLHSFLLRSYVILAGYPASLGRKGGMEGGGERERSRGLEGEGEGREGRREGGR